MSFPPLFKDHGKSANDILGKGFPSTDRFIWKFESDTTSVNGIQFTPSISYDGSVSGEFKAKGKVFDQTATLSTKTDNSISIETVLGNNIAGFKPTLTLTTGFANLNKFRFKVGTERRAENFNTTLSVDVPNPLLKEEQDNVKFAGSFVVGQASGASAGVEAEANVDKRNLEKVNFVLAHTKSDYQFSIFGKKTYGAKSSLVLGVNSHLRVPTNWNNLIVASELSHTVDGPTNLMVGAQFNPDAFSTLKFRLKNTGSLGFSYSQHWGGPFTLTFMGESGKIFGSENPLTWGVKLSLK